MKPRWPVQLSSGSGEESARWKAKLRCVLARSLKVVLVEDLLLRARAVPEADLARGLLGFEQVREVGAQRSHAGAAADVNHLPLRGLDMEIAEGADGGDDVAGLEAEDVAGTDAGSAVLAGRRRGDADVEAQRALRLLVAGERVIVAPAGLGVARHKIEDVLVFPDGGKGLGDVEVAEADRLVGGDVELQVVARREGDLLAAHPAVREPVP